MNSLITSWLSDLWLATLLLDYTIIPCITPFEDWTGLLHCNTPLSRSPSYKGLSNFEFSLNKIVSCQPTHVSQNVRNPRGQSRTLQNPTNSCIPQTIIRKKTSIMSAFGFIQGRRWLVMTRKMMMADGLEMRNICKCYKRISTIHLSRRLYCSMLMTCQSRLAGLQIIYRAARGSGNSRIVLNSSHRSGLWRCPKLSENSAIIPKCS